MRCHVDALLRARGKVCVIQQRRYQKNSLLDAGLAKSQGLLQSCHGESVGCVERTGDWKQSMPVSVRLDHGHDAASRTDGANHGKIVAHRCKVDARFGGILGHVRKKVVRVDATEN